MPVYCSCETYRRLFYCYSDPCMLSLFGILTLCLPHAFVICSGRRYDSWDKESIHRKPATSEVDGQRNSRQGSEQGEYRYNKHVPFTVCMRGAGTGLNFPLPVLQWFLLLSAFLLLRHLGNPASRRLFSVTFCFLYSRVPVFSPLYIDQITFSPRLSRQIHCLVKYSRTSANGPPPISGHLP